MTKTNKKSNTSNLFRKIKNKLGSSQAGSLEQVEEKLLENASNPISTHQNPYYSPDQVNVLFLSKRGLSRAPLAREVMRKLLHFSDHFGSIRPSARGISDAYEFCPFDKRMILAAEKFGYQLSGNSRRVNMAELSSANLIITLDLESEVHIKSRKFYIRGQVKPVGMFLSAGEPPYITDPFDPEEAVDGLANYDHIIRSIEFACSNLLKQLPVLV
jgi:protein-tyrosine-phosphatase